MVGSVAALKTDAPRAMQAPRTQSRAENPQKTMKGWRRLEDACVISSGWGGPSCGRALGKFLESGIDFGNFNALQAGLEGIVMRLIRGWQDGPGVPDDADMISFREPEFGGGSAKGDEG